MKYTNSIFTLLLTTLGFIAHSQETNNFKKTFTWSEDKINIDPTSDQYIEVYKVSDGYINLAHPEIPSYSAQIKIDRDYDVDITAEIIKSSPISIKTDEARNQILPNLKVWHKVMKRRNEYYLQYGFIPVVGQNGNFQKIESIRISYSLSNPKSSLRGGPTFASNSVLAEGDIYKIAIPKSGVYKLTYDFLKNLGLNIDNINPKNLSIYTNHGSAQPENLNEDRLDDLQESAILIKGEEDNTFNSSDFIMFYAEGSESWSYVDNSYQFNKNIYDNNNYAYIKVGNQAGKRINASETISNPEFIADFYYDLQRYEEDKVNLLGEFSATQGTGQLWFGDRFNTTREYNYKTKFDLSNYFPGEAIDINLGFASRASGSSKVYLDIDGNTFNKSLLSIGNVSPSTGQYARYSQLLESTIINDPNTDIVVSYPFQSSGSTNLSEGWIDYLQLIVPKTANFIGGPLLISNQNLINYNTAGIKLSGSPQYIWDITNINNIVSTTTNNGTINFAPAGKNRMFITFNDANTLQAIAMGKVENQNLHAIADADMLVIYHELFAGEVDRFVDHRSTHSGLNIEKVNIKHIYNEFSGGKVDPTAIRDFAKMLYDRSSSFRYMLLVGDGTYDYKQTMPDIADHNFIPVYETKESLHPIFGFPSDDYYALLDLSEGTSLVGQLDIAVGRIPVKTAEEFAGVVNKIIHYDTSSDTYGDWRLTLGFVADDEDNNLHLSQTERIANLAQAKYPIYNQQKIYLDAFLQESTPGGERYPDATKAIYNNIFKGVLVMNYLGHGGPKGWSQERVLQVSDVQSYENFDKLPLLITATCSFTGYDEPNVESAGELSILNKKGGSIALFSTVRAVFANDNERLVTEVYDTIFRSSNLGNQTLGDIITNSKNNNAKDTLSVNSRKFAMIGDPSMKLAVPRLDVFTTMVNNIPISEFSDTLKALEQVTIQGIVADTNGQVVSDYNGIVYPTIYDKKSTLKTLANDPGKSYERQYEIFKNIIFKGAASVVNGKFSFTFVVPKDINYSYATGRISYYANNSSNVDAGGYTEGIIVGGTSNSLISDNQGPDIKIFMNDESWVYGGSTNSEPILLVKLEDENGINVAGTSIGHDLSGVLDDDNQATFIMNEYYEAEVDNYKKGIAKYPMNKLKSGRHTINIKAWDVLNNSSEARSEFVVIADGDNILKHVLNYPNPFTTSTNFQFEHDLANTDLDILVTIYTVTGKVIKTIEAQKYTGGYRIDDIHWDGKDDFGSKIGKGVYLYKIKVRSNELKLVRESDFEKLVILN